jgi:hypothetical protein
MCRLKEVKLLEKIKITPQKLRGSSLAGENLKVV